MFIVHCTALYFINLLSIFSSIFALVTANLYLCFYWKKKNAKIYFDFFTSNCISMWFKYKRIHVCVRVWRTQGKLIATHNQQLSAGRNAYQSAIDLLIYCALLSDGENIRLTENAHTPALDLPMKQIYGTQISQMNKRKFSNYNNIIGIIWSIVLLCKRRNKRSDNFCKWFKIKVP